MSFFSIIISKFKKEKKIKDFKIWYFFFTRKKTRIGRNPKTKEEKKFQVEMLYYLNHLKNLKNL